MSTMPFPIDEMFLELKIEPTWLHGPRIIYRQLFVRSRNDASCRSVVTAGLMPRTARVL